MRKAILVNPASGKLSIEQKKQVLEPIAERLNCEIHGWDTHSGEELSALARDLSKDYAVVIAGGDGTFADALNGVVEGSTLGFVPLGTGVALTTAMGLYGSTESLMRNILGLSMMGRTEQRLYFGGARPIDVIRFNEKRNTLMPTVGVEAEILLHRARHLGLGRTGINSYLHATKDALCDIVNGDLQPVPSRLDVDGEIIEYDNLSTAVNKHPYFGYGLPVNPSADFGDGNLHVRAHTSAQGMIFAATMARIGLMSGIHRKCQEATLTSEKDQAYQLDGDYAGRDKTFHFRVLPNYVNLIY